MLVLGQDQCLGGREKAENNNKHVQRESFLTLIELH